MWFGPRCAGSVCPLACVGEAPPVAAKALVPPPRAVGRTSNVKDFGWSGSSGRQDPFLGVGRKVLLRCRPWLRTPSGWAFSKGQTSRQATSRSTRCDRPVRTSHRPPAATPPTPARRRWGAGAAAPGRLIVSGCPVRAFVARGDLRPRALRSRASVVCVKAALRLETTTSVRRPECT